MKVESAWQNHQQRLFMFIRARVESDADAEDMRNSVFTKLVDLSNQRRTPQNISAWVG